MTQLLDTDHLSIVQWPDARERAAVVAGINLQPPGAVAVSVVSFQEQARGAHNLVNTARDSAGLIHGYEIFHRVITAYTEFPVLQFDVRAGTVLNDLKARKVRIKPMDLRIAAVALANDLTLVTRNVSDFGKVPGLRTEDWTK